MIPREENDSSGQGYDTYDYEWDAEKDLGIVAHTCSTRAGYSGSPVLSVVNGHYVMHGMHAFGAVVSERTQRTKYNYFVSYAEVDYTLSLAGVHDTRARSLQDSLETDPPKGKKQGKSLWRRRRADEIAYSKADPAEKIKMAESELAHYKEQIQMNADTRTEGYALDKAMERTQTMKIQRLKDKLEIARRQEQRDQARKLALVSTSSGLTAVTTRRARWSDITDADDEDEVYYGGPSSSSDDPFNSLEPRLKPVKTELQLVYVSAQEKRRQRQIEAKRLEDERLEAQRKAEEELALKTFQDAQQKLSSFGYKFQAMTTTTTVVQQQQQCPNESLVSEQGQVGDPLMKTTTTKAMSFVEIGGGFAESPT
jgi:hypothetical protein